MRLSIIEFGAGRSQCLANSVMYELSALDGTVSMSGSLSAWVWGPALLRVGRGAMGPNPDLSESQACIRAMR